AGRFGFKMRGDRLFCKPLMRALRKSGSLLCPKGLSTTAALATLLAGCATSSYVLVGAPRPAISPDNVKVYVQPPPKYDQIAVVDATSQGSFAITSQQNMDKAIERMRRQAAKLGANGILLQGVEDRQSGSIGTGVGNSNYSGNSAVGV